MPDQLNAYGAVLLWPMDTPSAKYCTDVRFPSGSEALTARTTGAATRAPSAKLLQVIDGASAMGLTVTVKFVLLESNPSLTVNVTPALPFLFVAGKTTNVRFDPLPEKLKFAGEIRFVFEDVP